MNIDGEESTMHGNTDFDRVNHNYANDACRNSPFEFENRYASFTEVYHVSERHDSITRSLGELATRPLANVLAENVAGTTPSLFGDTSWALTFSASVTIEGGSASFPTVSVTKSNKTGAYALKICDRPFLSTKSAGVGIYLGDFTLNSGGVPDMPTSGSLEAKVEAFAGYGVVIKVAGGISASELTPRAQR